MEPEQPSPDRPAPPALPQERPALGLRPAPPPAGLPQERPALGPRPAPPSPELLRPVRPPVPLTPMMDFFQRRLETLERELTIERERSTTAQSMLRQQEALRSEVENYLKSVTDQLKKEKTERESEQSKAHARGRIDALENRLDEVNQTFASLLKEAVAQREGGIQAFAGAQETLKNEVSTLSERLRGALDQLAEWRDELRGTEHGFKSHVGERLEALARQIRDSLGAWEKQQVVESEKLEARLEAIGRERETLTKAWEEQNHAIRQEYLKERIERETRTSEQIAEAARRLDQRETRTSEQIAEAARRLDHLKAAEEQAAEESRLAQAKLAQVVEILMTPPKAKDEIIAALEMEKEELARALKERAQALEKYMIERRGVEESLGNGVSEFHAQIDKAREENRALSARVSELELAKAVLEDRLQLAEKRADEKDDRREALASERDQLARALLAESGRVRTQIEERSRSDEDWARKLSKLQQEFAEAVQLKASQSSAVADLRAQVATLTEHMAKALQEKDAVISRFASWEEERGKLLKVIKEKDETLAMLNATFQGMLQKP